MTLLITNDDVGNTNFSAIKSEIKSYGTILEETNEGVLLELRDESELEDVVDICDDWLCYVKRLD